MGLDLGYTDGGLAVLRFVLAGEVEEGGAQRPFYFPVRFLGERAEKLAERLEGHQGAVVVRGELEQYQKERGAPTRTSLLGRGFHLVEDTLFGGTDSKGQRREAFSLNRFVGTGLAVGAPEPKETSTGKEVVRVRASFRRGARGSATST